MFKLGRVYIAENDIPITLTKDRLGILPTSSNTFVLHDSEHAVLEKNQPFRIRLCFEIADLVYYKIGAVEDVYELEVWLTEQQLKDAVIKQVEEVVNAK